LEQATHPQLRHSHSSTHDHEAVVVVEMPYQGLGERGDLLA
jgi:hypothetical protein